MVNASQRYSFDCLLWKNFVKLLIKIIQRIRRGPIVLAAEIVVVTRPLMTTITASTTIQVLVITLVDGEWPYRVEVWNLFSVHCELLGNTKNNPDSRAATAQDRLRKKLKQRQQEQQLKKGQILSRALFEVLIRVWGPFWSVVSVRAFTIRNYVNQHTTLAHVSQRHHARYLLDIFWYHWFRGNAQPQSKWEIHQITRQVRA